MTEEGKAFRMIAKTFAGLEYVLADELMELGANGIRTVQRGVEFYGDKAMMYKANYLCRSALRIIKPIAVFKAINEGQLYNEVKKIQWSDYLDLSGTFSINGITSHSNITHSKYLALKTKDALVDRFREETGKRPNVNKDNPDLSINVRVFRNECTISLDSSGESLHKRGYRMATGPAPLNEVLAAGMILISGWDKKSPFVDPMCGSGTLPIEAALIALNIPAGKFRDDYSFKRWNDFDADLWDSIKQEAKMGIKNEEISITGSDWSGRILQSAKENAEAAGISDAIRLYPSFFADTEPPAGKGVLITNPPYGERIKTEDIENLYKELGDTFKQHYSGYEAWVISSHMEAMKHIGLRASRNITLFNGPLECRFARYDLYEGSKKHPDDDRERRDFSDKRRSPGRSDFNRSSGKPKYHKQDFKNKRKDPPRKRDN